MRFLQPWERMRQACGASVDTRPIYSTAYEEDGAELVATVGNRGMIAIIFASPVFHIFEDSGESRSVPFETVTEMWYFDD
jgi:hypothetical protein